MLQPTLPLSSVLAIEINLLKEHVFMDKMDSNPAYTHKKKKNRRKVDLLTYCTI